MRFIYLSGRGKVGSGWRLSLKGTGYSNDKSGQQITILFTPRLDVINSNSFTS